MSDDFDDALAAAQAGTAALADQATPGDGICPTCGQSTTAESNGMLSAATSNDELTLLIAIRNKLSAAIETCPMRDLSPLTRRLQDVIKEIREIEERRAKESGSQKKAGEGSGDNSSGEWNPATDV